MKPGSPSDRVLLVHVRECIERVREDTGDRRTAFLDLRLVQDAVVRNLQMLAESTQRLSEPPKVTEPDVPWQEIAGFRNVLAHGYLMIGPEAVWSVVEQDLPELAGAIERMTRVIRSSE